MVGTRRTVYCCEGRGFAGLEFDGFCGVPQRVAINKSAVYGVLWNRIRDLKGVTDFSIEINHPVKRVMRSPHYEDLNRLPNLLKY